MTSLDPTSSLGIGGVGCHRYCLICVWSKFESCYVNFNGFVASRLKRLLCKTWGAFVLMVVCGHTCHSNVISIMFFTTIFIALMGGLTCMFEVFISVCCMSNFGMMIQLMVCSSYWGIALPWSPLIAWACVDLGLLEHVHLGGCIRHLNIVIKYRHVQICIIIVTWLCPSKLIQSIIYKRHQSIFI
jgi:hypothetical protein